MGNANGLKQEQTVIKEEVTSEGLDTTSASSLVVKPEPGTDGVNLSPMATSSAVKLEPESEETTIDAKTTSLTPPASLEAWTEFSICLADRVIFVRQDEERGYIYHRTLLPYDATPATSIETELWLRDYLNLAVPLEDLYEEWAAKDPIFGRFAQKFRGIRMLRQDPWECLCAFICSSNNNIARIGQMVQNLCTHFAPKLLSYEYPLQGEEQGEDASSAMVIDYHPFPSPQALAQDGVEQTLRELGFGYRAKYIHQTAKMLCEEHTRPASHRDCDTPVVLREIQQQAQHSRIPPREIKPEPKADGDDTAPSPHSVHSHLSSLRHLSYPEARTELLKLQGVGPKVADCILLMSLDQPSSIPVDRHVFQFAAKWYGLRNAKYETLAEHFRALWGDYAGWAHSVLFTADLRAFKDYDGVKKEESVSMQSVKKEEGGATVVKTEETVTTSVAPPAEDDPSAGILSKRKSRTSMSARDETWRGEKAVKL